MFSVEELPSKVSGSYFSFTPGFSPVIILHETHKNRF